MDNSIYEVECDEYVGFIGQLNKSMMDVEHCALEEENMFIVKIKSKKTGIHLCSRVIDNGEEHYFVFNMPNDEERVPPKPVRKITLETKEEVQAFFDVLNKLHEAKKDD